MTGLRASFKGSGENVSQRREEESGLHLLFIITGESLSC